MTKVIFCICDGLNSEELELINKKFEFDEVHLLDNLKNENIKELNLSELARNLGINEINNEIIIVSNNSIFLEQLWLGESWNFKMFISMKKINSNLVLKEKNNMHTLREIDIKENITITQKAIINRLNYILDICDSEDMYRENYSLINGQVDYIVENINCKNIEVKNIIIEKIYHYFEERNSKLKIYILSFLLKLKNEDKFVEEIQNLIKKDSSISVYGKYFLIQQIMRSLFISKYSNKEMLSENNNDIYVSIVKELENEINIPARVKKKNNRNDYVFLLISQFIGESHAPTKIILNKAKFLIEKMDKKVIIINTRELLSDKGLVPFYGTSFANIISEYNSLNKYKYKGLNIPFYQVDISMPNINEIQNIINLINKYNPSFIINIGGWNITADLLENITSVITIPMTNSLYLTRKNLCVLGKKIGMSEREYLKKNNFDDSRIIESKFMYSFEQHGSVTREELGIPEDKFIVLFMGNRLKEEVDEKFIDILKYTVENGGYLVSIGDFQVDYKKYPTLQGNSKCLGVIENYLSVIENIDLYINPKRIGGGTSGAAALYKGKPVITLAYGDVADAVGEKFIVKTYEEYKFRIKKLMNDSIYYRNSSKEALVQGKVITNEEMEFKRVLRVIEKKIKKKGAR